MKGSKIFLPGIYYLHPRKKKGETASKHMLDRYRCMGYLEVFIRKPAVINLDTYAFQSKSGSMKKTKASQPWLPTLNLHISEQDILLSPTAWITDTIVNAAQNMLKKQFPSISGLQDVALGLVNFNIQTGEFVQILHTAEGHWLAISTLGLHHPDVNIYDSVYLNYTSNISEGTNRQLIEY